MPDLFAPDETLTAEAIIGGIPTLSAWAQVLAVSSIQSLYLDPLDLDCQADAASMRTAAMRRIQKMLPRQHYDALKNNSAYNILMVGELLLRDSSENRIIFILPDPRRSLSYRLRESTKIPLEAMGIDRYRSAHGFDNFILLQRILLALTCLQNGGAGEVLKQGKYDLCSYRSMLSARQAYLSLGGNADVFQFHEAALYVAAFTRKAIPYQYLGFACYNRGASEYLAQAYRDINFALDSAHKLRNHDLPLQPLQSLFRAYMRYECRNSARRLSALRHIASSGNPDVTSGNPLKPLSQEELFGTMKHYITYQTLQGFKVLMGTNYERYSIPNGGSTLRKVEKMMGAFAHGLSPA
ncbi:MAG: hypothetical protein ABTQ34_06645 [Bdellovibrionales bacterium]